MSYIAVRVKPLKKWSDVANAARHGRREDPARHVDRSRTHLNRHWAVTGTCEFEERPEPANIEKAFNIAAAIVGANWRKGAIVGTEMLFIASPEYFNDYDTEWDVLDGKAGSLNAQRVNKWAEDCLVAAQARFPGQIAAARLDMDEKTPHLAVFMLPMYEKTYEGSGRARKRQRAPRKTISHNQVFGTPEALSSLQDWIAAEMKARGHEALQRGRRKAAKGPDHLTPAEGRRLITAAKLEADRIVENATKEAERRRGEQAEEVENLYEAVRQRDALIATIRAVLREALPRMYEKLRILIEAAWARHPLNSNRQPAPKPQSEAVSRPPQMNSPGME